LLPVNISHCVYAMYSDFFWVFLPSVTLVSRRIRHQHACLLFNL